jgi:hypothetical protein
MDGPEPHLRQLEGRRGARGDGPRDHAAVVPESREIARLDLDALGSPRPGLAQGPILERHGASGHDEAVDRDVERDTTWSGAEEVGDIEIVRAAHDADRRALQHGIGDREVPSQQRERPHARVESLDGDEERLVIALEKLEPGHDSMAREGIHLHGIDPHRAVRDAAEARDDEMADDDRPGERHRDRGHCQREAGRHEPSARTGTQTHCRDGSH